MSKWKGKLARRIMAIVLSGAMVMSNMSAYAAELAPEQETEIVSEVGETVEAEATADTAEEEAVSDAKAENAETEASVVESSESNADKSSAGTTVESETEDANETLSQTEAVESTVAETESEEEEIVETETAEIDNKESVDTLLDDNNVLDFGKWIDKNSIVVGSAIVPMDYTAHEKDKEAIFNIVSSDKSKFEKKSGTAPDDNSLKFTGCINTGGTGNKSDRYIKITVKENSKITAYGTHGSTGSADERVLMLVSDDGTEKGKQVLDVSGAMTKLDCEVEQGTYYLYVTKSSRIYYVSVTPTGNSGETVDRGDWNNVAAPEINTPISYTIGENKITVTVKGVVAPTGVGADKVEVDMYDTNTVDEDTTPVATKSSSKATEADTDGSHLTALEFTPEASGSYYFKARLVRADEKDEEGNVTTQYEDKKSELTNEAVEFKLPLATPTISTAKFTEKNADEKGVVSVSWSAVAEAEYYVISAEYTDDTNTDTKITPVKYTPKAEEAEAKSFTETLAVNMDSVVSVSVQAFRNTYNENDENANTAKVDYSEKSDAKEVKVTEDADRVHIDILQDKVTVTENNQEVEKSGLKAGKTYGDSKVVTLELLEDMPQKNDATQPTYIQGSVNPDPKDGKIPTKGAVFKIKPVKSVNFTFDLYSISKKTYWLVNESGKYDGIKGEITGSDAAPETPSLNFELHAGETYYFYVQGSKAMVTDISYKKWTTNIDILQDKVTVTENNQEVEKSGLKAGKTYGDSKVVTLELLEDMPQKNDATQPTYIQGSVNPDPKDGKIPTKGAVFKIKPVKSVNFTFDLYSISKKTYWLVNESGKYDGIKGEITGSDTAPETPSLNFELHAGETYYFYVQGSKAMVTGISYAEWDSGEPEIIDRGDWANVAAPEIVNAVQKDGKITVTVKGVINKTGAGADALKVEMYNANHISLKDAKPLAISNEITTNTSADAEGNHLSTVTFTPSESGIYAFKAILSRKDETDDAGNVTTYEDKTSAFSDGYTFNLQLAQPVISTLKNLDAGEDGNGVISITWNKVNEAEYYSVLVADENGNEIQSIQNIEATSIQVGGLSINSTVVVTVKAFRDNEGEGAAPDESEWSAAKTITVTGREPNTYRINAADYKENTSLTAGTKLGTKNYFDVMLNSSLSGTAQVKSASTGNFIEINKYGSAGIKFTVYGTADATFTVASTGGSNDSAFGLVNPEGKLVTGSITGAGSKSQESKIYEADTETKGMAYIAHGTTTSSVDYVNLPAGTYTFLSPNAGFNRGGRIHSVVVYDSADMTERGPWDNVSAPVISEITYAKGDATIGVKASGYIAYDGADSLKVDMLDADGKIVETIIKATDSTKNADGTFTHANQEFVFTPKASSDYSFRASLVRSGSDDIVMADKLTDWTIKDFVLPLATPSVSSMTNVAQGEDKGKMEVIFTGVDEADYYVVAAFSDTSFNKDNSYVNIQTVEDKKLDAKTEKGETYTVVLENLPLGQCYITVQAFRDEKNSLNKKAGLMIIKRDAEDKIIVETIEGTDKDKLLSWKLEILKATTEKKDDETDEKYIERITSQADKWLKAVLAEESGFAPAVARSQAASGREKYVNGKNDTRWFHSVYGSNTTRSDYTRKKGLNAFDNAYPADKDIAVPANGYKENVFEEGENKGDLKSVQLWSENGRGKVVPNSTDGFSYYYTSVNPEENNFTLSALIHVMSWQYSNGQDGFGMMVSDVAGKDGDDGAAWTNAYQLLASKIQYSWFRAGYTDNNQGYVTNAGGNGTSIMRYEMKLGVGWNSKEGATAADVAKIKSGAQTAPVNFITNSGTLETSAGNNDLYTGPYNIIGNCYNAPPTASDKDLLTDFRFQIQKYDNAYVLRYLAVDATAQDAFAENEKYIELNGNHYRLLGEQVFSDDNNNKLTQIDKQNIYVGFFAARNARIDISQINMDVTKAGSDEFPIPTTFVDPSASFSSEEASNNKDYDLVFGANFDGTLTIYKDDVTGKEAVVTGKAITAGTKYTFTNEMQEGETKFTFYAKPDENFVPGDNQKLKNFDMQTNETEPFSVVYHAFRGNEIYVAPNGAPVGTEYKVTENETEVTYYAGCSPTYPTNVYDAVNYAAAGQTILLAGGMYNLTEDPNHSLNGAAENLLIGKKHDGTSRNNITMKADPQAQERPVLNFGQNTIKNDTAFTMAGNYWYFQGFDVMGSRDGQKGILLGGSHNILNDVRTYLNGNTGLQVARYANYGREDWPSYNTILNCSSFMNYDAGYEDADGYAAKLTCGDGNKFIGCIAAYNADDGWDLFAKVESGSIGVVTIENCLAFKNGYLFGEEDYYGSGQDLIYRYTDFNKYTKNTHVVNAGNGNGFKMGGDSMSGYHVLRNSVAFGNKSKGVDSNSCPDIQVYNSISFNNEANNVAMYTGGAVNTDFYAEKLVSIKDSNAASGYSTADSHDLRGTQNVNKVKSAKNYYWNGSKSVNSNNDTFDLSWFKHTNVTTAIFGKTQNKNGTRITRSEDGSIVMNGFLEYTEEGLKALDLQSAVIGTTPAGDVLDPVIDLYVFAEEYKGKATLNQINLKDFESTKALAEAGYSWKKEKDANGEDIEVELAAFAGTTAEFTAVAAGKQDRTIAISFIQLDGAELLVTDGDTNNNGILNDGETWTVEAVPVISPAVEPQDVKLSGFAAEVKETTRGLLTAEGSAAVGAVNAGLNVTGGQVKYKGSGSNGDAKLTATVTLTVNGKAVKKNATLDVKVKNARNIKFDSIEISDPKKLNWTPDNDYIEIDRTAESFTMKNLRALDDKGAEIGTKGVKIKVNDTNIIKLSQAPKGDSKDAVFQIVDKNNDGGTATVTVTSADDKTLVRNYIVTLKGSEFAWNAANVEIDKAKLAGVQVSLLEPFGKKLAKDSEIKVKEVYKGAKVVEGRADSDLTGMFTVKSLAAGTNVYELNTSVAAAGKAGIAKGTYTLVCEAKTTTTVEGADPTVETTAFTPITIKVTESKPAVTFKQTKKVNFFYKKGTAGSTGKLLLSSKQGKVTLVADVDKDGKAKAIKTANGYFRFAGTGTEYDIIADNKNSVTVDPTNGRADFKEAKADGKISLTAHVEGYYPEYDVVKNISVAMEYKQPKLKLTAIDKTIYTAIGMKSADVLIYDPVADMYLGTDIATIELKGSDAVNKKAYSKINDNFTVGEVTGLRDGKNGVRLTLKEGAEKGGALRLSISYDDWISGDAVIVNQSIQVTNSIPKLTVKPAKLNMNPEKFVGKEQVDVPVIMNGAEGFTISEYTVTGSNDKATAFLTDYVDAKLVKNIDGNYVLRMSLKKKDGKFPAEANRGVYKMSAGYASSYGFVLNYKLGTMTDSLSAPVKLSLVSKETVTVGVSGSINMANRLGSTVTLKPKMTNFTAAQVSAVKLTGDAANLFEIVSHDRTTGATIVKAKETAVLKKGSYKVTPEFTIDLGKEGSTTIRPLKPILIKTAQPTLKISGLKDALEVKLSTHTTSAKRTITVGNEGAFITGMTQTSGLNNFKLSYDAGGNNVIVTIKDRAGLKEGTVYKITALVTVEGGGTNVKQQVITIPVRVIR